jgi:hypothetical protein
LPNACKLTSLPEPATRSYFATAEEASLVYARSLGKEKLLALLAAQQEMTAEEALAAAEAEGLQLVRATTTSGFAHVSYMTSQLSSAEKAKRTRLYRVYAAGNQIG